MGSDEDNPGCAAPDPQQVPHQAEAKDRYDPRIRDDETARAQLQIMTAFLNLWETRDMERVVRELESRAAVAPGGESEA